MATSIILQDSNEFELSELDRLFLEALYELQFHGTLTRDETHFSGYRIVHHSKGAPLIFVELWLASPLSYTPGCERFWARETPQWAKDARGCEGWDLPKRYEAAMRSNGKYNPERQLTLDARVNRLEGLGYVKRFTQLDWAFPDTLEFDRYDGKTIRVVRCKVNGKPMFMLAANIGDIDPKTREYVTISLLMRECQEDGFDFVRLQPLGINTIMRLHSPGEATLQPLRMMIQHESSEDGVLPLLPTTRNNLWDELGDRERNCLRALNKLKAFDADSRRFAKEVAIEADGPDANVNGFKQPLSNLALQVLIHSRAGSKGGYWLSDVGRGLLAAFDSIS